MSIELRPLGVTCNLSCHYCYQQPQRDAGNHHLPYDLEKMKLEAARIGEPFTLFGGEPLLMPFDDLEHIFSWGMEKFGSSSIQTNGALIADRHIELFRKYKVNVGISIDGPAMLNDVRWHGTVERTRKTTDQIEHVIERLCAEYKAPGLIVTLHQGNATAEKLPVMNAWMRRLDRVGIKSVRLHLLEIDNESLRDTLALSARQNIEAMLTFAKLENELKNIRFDLFRDMQDLLMGRDERASCIWRTCDPYTTRAVQGIEGNGQSSNCGRTNKDGIDFIKAPVSGYERYIALHDTPQSDNGCSGCRFFLMCKGQCPGTAIGGDWRNRTEHCEEWKYLFRMLERRLILSGEVPLTIQPLRLALEKQQIDAWEKGSNPSLQSGLSRLNKRLPVVTSSPKVVSQVDRSGESQPAVPRISWVSRKAQELWQERLERIQAMLEDMTVITAQVNRGRLSVRRIPSSGASRQFALAAQFGLDAVFLPDTSLPDAVCTRPGVLSTGILWVGNPDAIAGTKADWIAGGQIDPSRLALPACCSAEASKRKLPASFESRLRVIVPESEPIVYLPEHLWVHSLHVYLGLSVLPLLPCRIDCAAWLEEAGQFLRVAAENGYNAEADWMREWMSWSTSWSELHGITEVKTPVFKMCVSSKPDLGPRRLLRAGSEKVECGATGLSFPFLKPVRSDASLVMIRAEPQPQKSHRP
jgi:uncharacterized protein